jgi:DNA polymerase I-like protein with 3'-5' exonuclease and polymerase domains
VQQDGRIHPSYNRLPATGRYSSSSPNAQNIPAFLRDIFIPEEGHVFVGADMDQIELRLLAEESKAFRLLNTIEKGLDPHNENMEVVYGPGIWQLEGAPKDRKQKGKGLFKSTRGVTKCVFYAWQYAASVPTIHQQVVSVEDDSGKLIYAHMGHRDIRDVVHGLGKALPEVPRWWENRRRLFRKQGYLADSLWGRRRDFRDQEKLNELVNHPIQSAASAIVHEAMLQLLWGIDGWATTGQGNGILLPFDFGKRTGLVNQCHDSLCFELPEDMADDAVKSIELAMNRRRNEGALLTYTAEADVGMSLLEV